MRQESEAYLRSAIKFSCEENPAEKEKRDALKERIISETLETLETFGIEGEEKTFVYSRNPHSSETTKIFKGRERITPEVEVMVDGNKHLLVLSEQLEAGKDGVELESVSLYLLNIQDRSQVGRKAVIHMGIDKDYVTNFRGEKATIEDLGMMGHVLSDLYNSLLADHPEVLSQESEVFSQEDRHTSELPEVNYIYDPIFDSLSRSQNRE